MRPRRLGGDLNPGSPTGDDLWCVLSKLFAFESTHAPNTPRPRVRSPLSRATERRDHTDRPCEVFVEVGCGSDREAKELLCIMGLCSCVRRKAASR